MANLRVGIVVPHIFMHREILPHVIFSPGQLALDLAGGLGELGVEVTLFTPGPVETTVTNIVADLSCFERELAGRGDSYVDLLKKHPFTFITLARQVQSEIIAKAYELAGQDHLDVVHIYTNEEDIALPFAKLCQKPVVLTHHDPFNFLVKYKNVFPKYAGLNWLSISLAQRQGMPENTNWLANIYHGLDPKRFTPNYSNGSYLAFIGRIVQPKGLHLAIRAVKLYNRSVSDDNKIQLKIAGKHYTGKKDDYWQTEIVPLIDGKEIEYMGFLKSDEDKQQFLSNASALVMPSTFEEPFGMVMIESLACGTPIIGLASGSIPEIVQNGQNGLLIERSESEEVIERLAQSFGEIDTIDRKSCRQDFEKRFALERMCQEHLSAYEKALQNY